MAELWAELPFAAAVAAQVTVPGGGGPHRGGVPQRVVGQRGEVDVGDLAEEQLRRWAAAQPELAGHAVLGPAPGQPPELAGGSLVAGGAARL